MAAEFLGVLGDYDRYSLEGKPELVKRMQDSTVIIDSLIMCMFTVDLGISVELYARCANLPTGMSITADDVYTIGERINTVERLFNIEEGFTRADDALPQRSPHEAAPSDPAGTQLDVDDVHRRVLRPAPVGRRRRADDGPARAARRLRLDGGERP